MALQNYTVAVGNLIDDGAGRNYAVGEPVYIKTTGGALAPIFRDEAGTSPIIQDGIANLTNEFGEFSFYVESGEYIIESVGNERTATIAGSDYFNNQIEIAVNQIIEDTADSRGFRVVGTFADGFDYELPNDVGTNTDGTAWIYVGSDPLPVTVPPGTDPTASGDYQQVTFNQASGVITDSGQTLQNFVDESYINFEQIADIDGDPRIKLGSRVSVDDYATGNNSGVLFFEVVAAGTGVDDGGKYIDLPTSGLQLSQLMRSGQVSVMQFGGKSGDNIDAALDAASMYLRSVGGGEVVLPPGDCIMTETWDGRKYNYISTADENDRAFVSINGNKTVVRWRGGKDGDGAYGTVFYLKRVNVDGTGTPVAEGAFLGYCKDVQFVADQISTGHAGGWSLVVGYSTIATPLAGCSLPDQANYPKGVAKTTSLEAIPDDQASCAIYYSGVSPTSITGNSAQRFAFGFWAGIGFGSILSGNYAKWCNVGIALKDAITRTTPSDNTLERNAIGMFFETSSACTIEKNVIQANYAGCDILMGIQNLEHVFKENYNEISPTAVVIRGAGGDVRNSNIKFIRNHALTLDINMTYVDSLLFDGNLFSKSPGAVTIVDGPNPKDDARIIIKNNRVPFTGDGTFEETYPLFTDWPESARKWIYSKDDLAASESLTDGAYYGRSQQYKGMVVTEAPVNFCEVKIPNERTYGTIKVRVRKSRPEDATSSLGTQYDLTYYVGYSRQPNAATEFLISPNTDGPGQIKSSASGPNVDRSLTPITVTGSTTGEQKIVISELAARLSAGAYNVTLDVENYSSTGRSRIKGLV